MTSNGRLFQTRASAEGKVQSPAVDLEQKPEDSRWMSSEDDSEMDGRKSDEATNLNRPDK
jgi:hypothetical protein